MLRGSKSMRLPWLLKASSSELGSLTMMRSASIHANCIGPPLDFGSRPAE